MSKILLVAFIFTVFLGRTIADELKLISIDTEFVSYNPNSLRMSRGGVRGLVYDSVTLRIKKPSQYKDKKIDVIVKKSNKKHWNKSNCNISFIISSVKVESVLKDPGTNWLFEGILDGVKTECK